MNINEKQCVRYETMRLVKSENQENQKIRKSEKSGNQKIAKVGNRILRKNIFLNLAPHVGAGKLGFSSIS